MWLVGLAMGASVDLQAGFVSARGPTRHTTSPAFGLRVDTSRDDRLLTFAGDLVAWRRTVDGEVYRHRSQAVRAAFGPGLHHDRGRVEVEGWVGPALTGRFFAVDTYTGLRIEPGLRASTSLALRFGPGFELRLQSGAACHASEGLRFDFDSALGLGVKL